MTDPIRWAYSHKAVWLPLSLILWVVAFWMWDLL
jgi:hypothetical protein